MLNIVLVFFKVQQEVLQKRQKEKKEMMEAAGNFRWLLILAFFGSLSENTEINSAKCLIGVSVFSTPLSIPQN